MNRVDGKHHDRMKNAISDISIANLVTTTLSHEVNKYFLFDLSYFIHSSVVAIGLVSVI